MTDAIDVTTPTDEEVVVIRRFDALPALVFDCHTKPDLVRRWLTGPPGWTMPVCEIDLGVGGRSRYEVRGPNGEVLAWGSVFREIVPPERIVSTDRFDDDWTGGET